MAAPQSSAWQESADANLLHFASLTPAQRLAWLADALEFWTAARENRAAGQGLVRELSKDDRGE